MTNIEKLYEAIYEYNASLAKNPRLVNAKYEEKRGMFFTCLRRYLGLGNTSSRPYLSMQPEDFTCVFREDGKLSELKILRRFHLYGWEEEKNHNLIGKELADHLADISKIYPTRELNEIALIVNRLK